MEKGPNIFLAWLSAHRLTAAAGLFCALLGVLIFWLYGLPGEAIVYLIGLCLDRHVFVDNTDAALSCHCNGHSVFCNGIHGSAHHRNI